MLCHQTLLQGLQTSLTHLNPQSVLERGFSLVRSAEGKIVRNSTEIALGDKLSITFAHGDSAAKVINKEDGR